MQESSESGSPSVNPGPPRGEGGEQYQHSPGERHRERRRYRVRRHSRPGLLILTLTLLILGTTGLVVVSTQMFLAERALADRQSNVLEMLKQAAALRSESSALKGELAALVQKRWPDLRPIRAAQVTPINDRLVKDILFTPTGSEEKQGLQFKLVLRNTGSDTARVRVKVLFYNRAGIQTGEAMVGNTDKPTLLGAGESVSFTGQAQRDPDDGLPVYFRIVGG
jgi:hypothetical protein